MFNYINTGLMLMAEGTDISSLISLLEIVIHVINLIILIVFLKILVYKPMLSFVENRRKNIQSQLDEGNRLTAEAEEIKGQSQQIIATARQNAEYIALEATKEAESKSKLILAEAKDKSTALIERTKKDMEGEKKRVELEVKNEIVDLAVNIASKILEREVNEKDNDSIINECLSDWGKR